MVPGSGVHCYLANLRGDLPQLSRWHTECACSYIRKLEITVRTEGRQQLLGTPDTKTRHDANLGNVQPDGFA